MPEELQDEVTAPGRPSVLTGLKQRRERIVQNLWTDIKVSHWDDVQPDGSTHPPLYVRYKPVDHGIISKGLRAVADAKKDRRPEVELQASIDLLIEGCIGVFALIDDEPVSLREGDPRGDLTTFDPDLAIALGLAKDAGEARNITASRVVRELFITEGDINSHAEALMKFSDFKDAETDDRLRGES